MHLPNLALDVMHVPPSPNEFPHVVTGVWLKSRKPRLLRDFGSSLSDAAVNKLIIQRNAQFLFSLDFVTKSIFLTEYKKYSF